MSSYGEKYKFYLETSLFGDMAGTFGEMHMYSNSRNVRVCKGSARINCLEDGKLDSFVRYTKAIFFRELSLSLCRASNIK